MARIEKVKVVVSGQPIEITSDDGIRVQQLMDIALSQTGNVGPVWEWELRDEDGRLWERPVALRDYLVKSEQVLYLQPRAGFGGQGRPAGRDLQVMTATRLQFMAEIKRWAHDTYGHAAGYAELLRRRLMALDIVLPDTVIVARCTCDDPGEGFCPVHGRENELQNRALEAEHEVKLLKARITVARTKMNSGLDLEQAIEDADEVLRGDADEYVMLVHPLDHQDEREIADEKKGTGLGPGWGQQ